MSSYLEPIKMAIIFFPFVALLISIPFILSQYHKYGSISFFRALLIYSFTLYFMCAYFLIILPLPKISEVALLKTPRMQLIPFSFIYDLFKNFSLATIYVPIYNILLTIPFGIYLRYYFKYDLKKVIKYSFLLSLFYELTQLSGLYFIYPRGYRLFDIDDLMLNTLGGFLGYFLSKPLIKLLPTLDSVDLKAKERGKLISGFKRCTSFCFDLFLFFLFCILTSIFTKFKYLFELDIFMYYFVFPIFFSGSTIGQKFLNLTIIDYNNNKNIKRIFLRKFLFILIYFALPLFFSYLMFGFIMFLKISNMWKEIIGLVYLGLLFIMYAVTGIKYLFSNKDLIYERISKTRLFSTIK